MTYLEWNDLLAKYFFSEEKTGKEVLLYVNEPLVNRLGAPLGAGVSEFVEATKTGPPWSSRSGICQKALQAHKAWRTRALQYPPYIGYLSLFVLAAGRIGDYAPHAYYPRLRDLLGENSSARLPSFDRMIDLWDDLEKWSREDREEGLGRFVARIRGQRWMVGLPLSQTLISEEEIRNLVVFLYEHELDPLDLPSPETVFRLIQKSGDTVLHRRTIQVLNGTDEISLVLRDALIDFVMEELEVNEETFSLIEYPNRRSTGIQVQPSLRLCLRHDSLSNQVCFRVRIRTSTEIPEDGCTFSRNGSSSIWKCTNHLGGWSDTLYDPNDSLELDGAILNWNKGETFHGIENQWTAKLRKASTRVFTAGWREGLPDFIERQRLERNVPFYIVSISENTDTILNWGKEHCDNFEQLNSNGLPTGWSLFSGENAKHSCQYVEALTISPSVRLLLKGGVKTGRSNVYLKGAPPQIKVENASGSETVTLDSRKLQKDDQSDYWLIPEDAEEGVPLRIELNDHGQTLRKFIKFESPNLPLFESYSALRRSPDGTPSYDSDIYVQGSTVHYPQGMKPPEFKTDAPYDALTHFTLIGAIPGQISVFPDEDLPDWQPVWAIVKSGRKQLKLVFCGTEDQAGKPYDSTKPIRTKVLVKRWKKSIWHDRKRITPPKLKVLQARWNEYLEIARNVK